jgi:hypothetical protein
MTPTFVGRLGWGRPVFWFSLPHFAVRRKDGGISPISLMPNSSKEGLSRVMKETVVLYALLFV